MFECHNPITQDERLEMLDAVNTLCDFCITQNSCFGCPVLSVQNHIEGCETENE